MDCSPPGFPVHHQLPEPTQTHVQHVSDAIQPYHPLSSPFPCLQSFLASGSFPMSPFFASGGQSNGVSALASVSSVQFSHSVVSDSLRPHELQHARAPCLRPTPRVHSNSRLSSWWWTGRPGVLLSMGSQGIRHDWVTELNNPIRCYYCPHFPEEAVEA